MSEFLQQPDAANHGETVLHYARPGLRPRLGWPVFLGIFQFIWLFYFLLAPLGWDRPKELAGDSIFFLMMASPSIAATIISFRVWRYHALRTSRTGPMVISLLICLTSATMMIGVILMWISVVVLDPHGSWSPI